MYVCTSLESWNHCLTTQKTIVRDLQIFSVACIDHVLFDFFHMICKISRFNMRTAKHLAQASCTELTLTRKFSDSIKRTWNHWFTKQKTLLYINETKRARLLYQLSGCIKRTWTHWFTKQKTPIYDYAVKKESVDKQSVHYTPCK